MYFCKEYNESKGKSLYEDKPINSTKNGAVNTGISQSFDLFTKYGCSEKGKVITYSNSEAKSGKGMTGYTPETQFSAPLLSLSSSYTGSCNTKDFLGQQSGSGSAIHGAAEPQWSQSDLKELYSLFRAAGSTLQYKHSAGAQLTICYGGTVNVYDDIPPDKAQAIILLASGKPVQNNTNYVSQLQWEKSGLTQKLLTYEKRVQTEIYAFNLPQFLLRLRRI
ncbi:uncharacterized protein LOC131044380 isoform X2 [Cryptomeria japonica]|uniref:uncharacterized protein LOC131044380 isoform X2 n=1 Tax=Cryptomeria japonica TaxID=3369 RepID=UPI0027DA4935|nr:uncharacterized protein LOC131044380 isoform X2 [Cryptomeria japonica]